MQRKIAAHTVSPFGTFGLNDTVWMKLVQDETKRIFDTIYVAAKNKDAAALLNIKESYLASDRNVLANHATVVMNGDTPMSLLAYEGDEEAVNFLLIHGAYHSLIDQRQFGISNRTKNWDDININVSFFMYPLSDAIAERTFKNPGEAVLLRSSHKDTISLSAYAYLGDTIKVNELLAQRKKTMTPYGISWDNATVGYYYAKHGHHDAAAALLPNGDSLLIDMIVNGCLESGAINQRAKYLSSSPFTSRLGWTIRTLSIPGSLRNRNHGSILFPSLVAINNKTDRAITLDHIFPTSKEDEKNNLYKTEILQRAARINHYIHTYHLNYEQAMVCSQPAIFAWVLQGVQFVKQGKLIPDVFINILSQVAEPALAQNQAQDLFNKVYFVINQTFLTDDLDHYLSGIYKSNRYHAARANSFKTACHEIDSAVSLRRLVADQHGLFAGKVIGDAASKRKHETPVHNQEKDEFVTLLEKHQQRLI